MARQIKTPGQAHESNAVQKQNEPPKKFFEGNVRSPISPLSLSLSFFLRPRTLSISLRGPLLRALKGASRSLKQGPKPRERAHRAITLLTELPHTSPTTLVNSTFLLTPQSTNCSASPTRGTAFFFFSLLTIVL